MLKLKPNKFSKIVYYVFLGFIILIAVLLLFSAFPITGNYKVLIVQSGSMEPTIHTGSIVITKPELDYHVGDIITFGRISRTQVPITHRIYKIENNKYITKGDANNAPDMKAVNKREIVGKVLFSVPYAGYVVSFARKPIGFVLIIGLPALMIISDEIKKIVQQVKKLKNISAKTGRKDKLADFGQGNKTKEKK